MFLKNTEEWRTLACVKTKNLCIFKSSTKNIKDTNVYVK